MKSSTTCECMHRDDDHAHRQGRCNGRDSYDLPCQCPRFEPYDDGEDDEPHPQASPPPPQPDDPRLDPELDAAAAADEDDATFRPAT